MDCRDTIAVLVLLLTRGATVADATARHNQDIAEFLMAAPLIEPGAPVLVAEDNRGADCRKSVDNHVSRLAHLGSFLTIEREAFIPITFAGSGMQPVRVSDRYRPRLWENSDVQFARRKSFSTSSI